MSYLLQMTCEKVLDLMCYMVLPIQDGGTSQEEPSKVKPKFRKGTVLMRECVTVPNEIIPL
jgi:hypothetical protein